MTFAAPTLLWLALLAPAAAAAAAWLWRRRLRAGEAWAARGLWDRLMGGYSGGRLAASVALLGLAVLGTALALARPRWGASAERVQRRGVDVVFVLDSSLSMAAADTPPSRLWVAQTLIRRLVEALPGHRVALIEAEGESVVAAPLTVDGGVLDLLLDSVEPGSLPVPGSLLAPALRQALRLFPAGGEKHRVVVLVSDGEDHGGGVEDAVDELVEERVVVHALGVGTPQGAPLPVPGGETNEVKRDQRGAVVISRLHEEVLEEVARRSGGVYLRATSPAADLAPLVARIDAMERRVLDEEEVATQEERFQWALAAAAAGLLLWLGLPAFRTAATDEVTR